MDNGFHFTWLVNFDFAASRFGTTKNSDIFLVGGCQWGLSVLYGSVGETETKSLELFLVVPDSDSLPDGWKRRATFDFTILNHHEEVPVLMDASAGFVLAHNNLFEFLSNGELLEIGVKLSDIELIGKSQLPVGQEYIYVNGFKVYPSQVNLVSTIFERVPNLSFHENPFMRSAQMSLLLDVIHMMCKPTQHISQQDLRNANAALAFFKDGGMDPKWLENTIKKVSENISKSGETLVKKMEEELKELKLKCSVLESNLEKERAAVQLAKARCFLTLDEVFYGF